MDNRKTHGKRYGLQVPKKPILGTVQPRLSVFGDDSDSEHEDGSDWVKKAFSKVASQNVQKKQTKLEIQRALKEDPTVYQYDEIYEQLEEKKQEAKSEKIAQERKPRYIQTLMAHAEQRKREQERRTERQVQKEREAEGEAFKDKEAFVTASYRKKLEEFRLQDEEERRQDAIEAITDVSKQKDLSGFYRHLFRQTLGEDKPTIKVEDISDAEQEAEVEKKQDEPDNKHSISVKKSDVDSSINKEHGSEITKAKEYHKERNPTLPPTTEDKREKTDNTNVSHVTDQGAVSEEISDTKEETSKNKPEEHDKNKRLPLSEISRKLVSEKHYANESNQDADTDISSSDSDSDTENKADNSRRRKKEAFRSRHYRRRQSSSSEESSSETESDDSSVLYENVVDVRDSVESTERNKPQVKERTLLVRPPSAPNVRSVINGDIREAEKENKTNVRKECKRANKPDLSIYSKRNVGAKLEEARRKFLARKAAREAKNIFF